MAEDVFQDFVKVTTNLKNEHGGLIDAYVILVMTEQGAPTSKIATFMSPNKSELPARLIARAAAQLMANARNRGASEVEGWKMMMGTIAEQIFTLRKVT